MAAQEYLTLPPVLNNRQRQYLLSIYRLDLQASRSNLWRPAVAAQLASPATSPDVFLAHIEILQPMWQDVFLIPAGRDSRPGS
jgi:hypothetical protein